MSGQRGGLLVRAILLFGWIAACGLVITVVGARGDARRARAIAAAGREELGKIGAILGDLHREMDSLSRLRRQELAEKAQRIAALARSLQKARERAAALEQKLAESGWSGPPAKDAVFYRTMLELKQRELEIKTNEYALQTRLVREHLQAELDARDAEIQRLKSGANPELAEKNAALEKEVARLKTELGKREPPVGGKSPEELLERERVLKKLAEELGEKARLLDEKERLLNEREKKIAP